MHAYIHTNMPACVKSTNVSVEIYTYIDTYMHTCMHIYASACVKSIYIYIHTLSLTHTWGMEEGGCQDKTRAKVHERSFQSDHHHPFSQNGGFFRCSHSSLACVCWFGKLLNYIDFDHKKAWDSTTWAICQRHCFRAFLWWSSWLLIAIISRNRSRLHHHIVVGLSFIFGSPHRESFETHRL